jgi:hypothetical protein
MKSAAIWRAGMQDLSRRSAAEARSRVNDGIAPDMLRRADVSA